MNQIFVITFTVFMFFSQNALGNAVGQVVDDIGALFSGTARLIMGRPTEKETLRRLHEIEKKLGFPDLKSSMSLADIDNLIKSRFNPLKDKAVKEAFDEDDIETLKTVLFEHIRKKHLNSPIILRWWNDESFRNAIFDHLNKSHLSNPWNPTLLLKWWEEAVSRGMEDRLELFMEQAFRNADTNTIPESYTQFSSQASDGAFNDRFIKTVFKATRENNEFARHVEQILENN